MKRNRLCWSKLLDRLIESPTTRRAGGLDFSAIGGKKQRHGSALIGAGVTACASSERQFAIIAFVIGCAAPGLYTNNHPV
jgi:hypothetical protein